jgi:hypothetical protein
VFIRLHYPVSLFDIHLSLYPSPKGEGLKTLIIWIIHPFSHGRRGWGMRPKQSK